MKRRIVGASLVLSLAAVGLILPASQAATPECTPDPSWGQQDGTRAARLLQLVNDHRAGLSLQPLTVQQNLLDAAVWKSAHLAHYWGTQVYGGLEHYDGTTNPHDDPAPPVARTMSERLDDCGVLDAYRRGENLELGAATAEQALQGWLDEPSHRDLVEDPEWSLTGIGAVPRPDGKVFWTLDVSTEPWPDGGGEESPASAPPVTGDDSVTIAEDGPETFVDVLANDSDPEGGALTLTYADGAGVRTSILGGRDLYIQPRPDFSGSTTVFYEVTDPSGEISEGEVAVTVTPVQDAPVAVDDAVRARPGVAKTIAVLRNDVDVDGDDLTVRILTGPRKGVAKVTATGAVRYKARSGARRGDSFTYEISDGAGGTDTATVRIRIRR